MTDRSKKNGELESGSNDNNNEQGHSMKISRRRFLYLSLATAATAGTVANAGVTTNSWLPLVDTVKADFGGESFEFAWVSDTHLYAKNANTRFADKTSKVFKEIQGMGNNLDFLIFGGDLAHRGRADELNLGRELFDEIAIKKLFIPGENDWYLDAGEAWTNNFGESPWFFDHKGVRIIGLNTVGQAPDYWSAKKMSPLERMSHMEALSGTVTGPWAGLGAKQLQWLDKVLSNWNKDAPVLVFTHNPLYEYYSPWNFWVRDWREVNEILQPYKNVTNIHGHVHQALYQETGSLRSIGMPAMSWPKAPSSEGILASINLNDINKGVGWGKLTMSNKNGDRPVILTDMFS